MQTYPTPADFLANGLNLAPLPQAPTPLTEGTCCAITGQPIREGYSVRDMVGDATAEFLDCFRGGVHGYVSEAAARCFKNADPRKGNPTARAMLVFADHYYEPLINRESALVQDRPCWRDLVREVWPGRRGQQMLMILTTDTKKRLWIRARVGTLGSRTPILCYDGKLCLNEVRLVDWAALVECLEIVEAIYQLGFAKEVMRESLYLASKVAGAVGLRQTRTLEGVLRVWRERPEFKPALLIAQKEGVVS